MNTEREGLGRYLLSFLKAISQRGDVKLVIACPSWYKQSLLLTCEQEGIDEKYFDIIAPEKVPLIVLIYQMLLLISAGNIQELLFFLRKIKKQEVMTLWALFPAACLLFPLRIVLKLSRKIKSGLKTIYNKSLAIIRPHQVENRWRNLTHNNT
jgi:hypothetical protein